MKRLLKNCDILISDHSKYTVLKDAYLGIEGRTIHYIDIKPPKETYDEIKDMNGALLIPGLINCHCHAPMVLLRGVGSDLPLQEWLFDHIMPIEATLTEEDIKAGTNLAIMEMLACGVTSFTDMYDFPHVTAAAAGKAGMKANLCMPLVCTDPLLQWHECPRVSDSIHFHSEYNGAYDGKILVDFGIHSEYLTTVHSVEYYAQACKDVEGRIQLHLSETSREHQGCKEKYGKTPAEWFKDLGVFDSPTYAAHCVHCEEKDLEIFKEKNVTLIHNPSSNMKLGSGLAPVSRALEMGINVTLGTDGAASNNNLNMFEEMHLAALIHKGFLNNATLIKPEQILAMVTGNGAKAQGRENTGELSVGKRADIVAISFKSPHMNPVMDVLPMLVYSGQGSDVKMTMVDGQILYEDGEYKTIDFEKTMADVRSSAKRLLGI
ncbi:MAG: amidohydrolase [Clostridia bacterium]|nr:amidohydrolase [Clostridia bacterium]